MKLARTLTIVIAIAITILFAWQANSPVFAKPIPPSCSGKNLMDTLKKNDPEAYKDLVRRENETLNGKGLLWKIERPGVRPSYLYGTMHMSDDRLISLPAPVAKALADAQSVALEIGDVLDEKKMASEVVKNISLIAFTDGRTIESVLSADELKLLKTKLNDMEIPYASSRIMKPWFVMLSMALPKCEQARQRAGLKALDATIALTAQKNGSKIIGLETVKEQFSAFASLSIKDQKVLLLSSLHMGSLLDDQIETMTQLYLQRRTAALWQFSLYMSHKYAKASKDELTALKNFEQALIVKRNKIMSSRAQPIINKGNMFMAVGALHLPGQHGLVALLRKAGYKLSVVY